MVLYVGTTGPRTTTTSISWTNPRLAARRLGVAGVTALHALVAEHASGPGEVVTHRDGPRALGLGPGRGRLPRLRPTRARRVTATATMSAAPSDAGDAAARRPRPHRPAQPPGGRRRQRRSRRSAHPRPRPPAVDLGPRPPDQPAAQRAQGVLPALEAFPELAHGDAVGVLSSAPGPREAARHLPDPLRARAAPPAHLERRAAPRGVAGKAPAAQGVRREHRCGNEGAPRSTVRSSSPSDPFSQPDAGIYRCPVSVWRRPGAGGPGDERHVRTRCRERRGTSLQASPGCPPRRLRRGHGDGQARAAPSCAGTSPSPAASSSPSTPIPRRSSSTATRR